MTERFFRAGELKPHVNIRRRQGRGLIGVIEALLPVAKPERAVAQSIIGGGGLRLELGHSFQMRDRRRKVVLASLDQSQTEMCQCEFWLNRDGGVKRRGCFAKLTNTPRDDAAQALRPSAVRITFR